MRIKKPHFYYMDLENYNDDFLIKIILWQKDEIEELNKKEWYKMFGIRKLKKRIMELNISNKALIVEINDLRITNRQLKANNFKQKCNLDLLVIVNSELIDTLNDINKKSKKPVKKRVK